MEESSTEKDKSQPYRDEAFRQNQVNFKKPYPATDEKALWSEGKR
ncbi:hypothetical protein CCACVL1_22659, partial [Corchorus capsularis]